MGRVLGVVHKPTCSEGEVKSNYSVWWCKEIYIIGVCNSCLSCQLIDLSGKLWL